MRMINVLIAVDRTKDTNRIAAALRSAGLQITRHLPRTGVIAGSAAESTLGRLRLVGGVLSVEREREHRFPPSASQVQ